MTPCHATEPAWVSGIETRGETGGGGGKETTATCGPGSLGSGTRGGRREKELGRGGRAGRGRSGETEKEA